MQAEVAQESVTGLCQCPGGLQALAASQDGWLTLLDLRQAGKALGRVSAPQKQPLRCCLSDGQTAVAGSSDGLVSKLRLAPKYLCFQHSSLYHSRCTVISSIRSSAAVDTCSLWIKASGKSSRMAIR